MCFNLISKVVRAEILIEMHAYLGQYTYIYSPGLSGERPQSNMCMKPQTLVSDPISSEGPGLLGAMAGPMTALEGALRPSCRARK